jgi:hypothetical protein
MSTLRLADQQGSVVGSAVGFGMVARVRLARADVLLALAVAAALCALYLATFQVRTYGDAPLLVQAYARYLGGEGQWGHVLYLPAARALQGLVSPPSFVDDLRLLSPLGVALAAGCALLLARVWGASRPAACAGALLFALAPGPWFFATTVEVHALHAACAGACALLAVLVPWRRGLWAALIVAASVPLLFLSHQSGVLLGPGFVLLSGWARERSGARPFTRAELWLVVAPLYLAAFLGAVAYAAGSLENSVGGFLGGTNATIVTFERGFALHGAREGWLVPLGLITPLVLWAVVARRLRGPKLAVLLLLVVPSFAFFVLWGVPERGGYALPSALFLAAAGAAAFDVPTRARWALPVLAVAIQAVLGWTTTRSFDEPHWRERNALRSAGVSEALPDGGTLISINVHNQFIEFQLGNVHEISLYDVFAVAVRDDIGPERFMERSEPILTPVLGSARGVALDLEGRNFIAQKAPHLLPYAQALEDWLRERCDLEPTLAAPATIVRLRRRSGRSPYRGGRIPPSGVRSTSRSGHSLPSTGTRRQRCASQACSAAS